LHHFHSTYAKENPVTKEEANQERKQEFLNQKEVRRNKISLKKKALSSN
jgi:hypothetical protein